MQPSYWTPEDDVPLVPLVQPCPGAHPEREGIHVHVLTLNGENIITFPVAEEGDRIDYVIEFVDGGDEVEIFGRIMEQLQERGMAFVEVPEPGTGALCYGRVEGPTHKPSPAGARLWPGVVDPHVRVLAVVLLREGETVLDWSNILHVAKAVAVLS